MSRVMEDSPLLFAEFLRHSNSKNAQMGMPIAENSGLISARKEELCKSDKIKVFLLILNMRSIG